MLLWASITFPHQECQHYDEHREYQASIGDLVAVEIVDFDDENVTRLLTTVESSRLQFLRLGNGSLPLCVFWAVFFFKPKKMYNMRMFESN
jgi:hypothetical protein